MKTARFLMAVEVIALVMGFAFLAPAPARAAGPPTHVSAATEAIQKTAENQIRRLVEPILDKYCHDQCKLLGVSVTAEITLPEQSAPGFEEIPAVDRDALSPTSARLKVLFDEKLGPISRHKLLDLVQQYLDTLDYPVKVDSQLVHFPEPAGSEGRIADLRDRLGKSFEDTISELIQQYCPDQCLLTDFNLKTETVNAEESQYGAPGEYVQDGNLALRIRAISATLLMDDSLSKSERMSILAMARLKTSSFHRVALTGKVIRFPRPSASLASDGGGEEALGADGVGLRGARRSISSKEDKTSNSQNDSKSLTDTKQTSNNSKTDSNSTNSSEIKKTEQNSNSSTQAKTDTAEKSSLTENNQRQERFERIEKIERVESGDAVQAELQKFKVYGVVFGASILALLLFIAMAGFRSRKDMIEVVNRNTSSASPYQAPSTPPPDLGADESTGTDLSMGGRGESARMAHFEISRLRDELLEVFSQNPKVTKYVFNRVLTEEGIEVSAAYMHIFGETIMIEMLRDPSMQSDLNELMEYYAKTLIELRDPEKLELLRKLHQRTVSGKLAVIGNRSSTLFDFLAEMDGMQILEMIRTESLTVKSIILTQCDAQKRALIYNHLDEDTRLKLLTELSRIDYLPRDYIFNVASALKRKRRDNPRLNTEALPGSEVLVSLLERTNTGVQRDVVKTLEATNPESARTVKGKLISLETLRYLRDGQLLEVVLSLKHDELLQFLKGSPGPIRQAVLERAPPELSGELAEELAQLPPVSREGFSVVERKVMNRMKLMANDGLINLVETNERMFTDGVEMTGFGQPTGAGPEQSQPSPRRGGAA